MTAEHRHLGCSSMVFWLLNKHSKKKQMPYLAWHAINVELDAMMQLPVSLQLPVVPSRENGSG